MKVYAPLPQADAPCLRGGRAVRTDRSPADRANPAGHPGMPQRPTGESLRWTAGAAHPVPAGPGAPPPVWRAGPENAPACPHRGDRSAAGPSAAKSSISGVMHRRRFFRSLGRRRGRPCSAAGAVIRGGREVRLRCPCCPGGRPGSFAGGSGVHSVGAVRGEVILRNAIFH